MTVADSHAVLNLYCGSPPGTLHKTGELPQSTGLVAVEAGLCDALSLEKSQHMVAGVLRNGTLIPGEVVS